MLFKCRDTNLFATGNAARNYNKSQMEFAEVILVAAALVENFKYKAAFTNTIKIKVSLKKLSKAYAYNTIFTFFFLEYN
jgi:hypothetical protein